jgi:hypothetical protein
LGLIATQMFKRAVRFSAHAVNAKSDYLRAAYQQLPLRYARLAGERDGGRAGGAQTGRHGGEKRLAPMGLDLRRYPVW